MSSYTDQDYIDFDPYDGDFGAGVRMETVKVVTVRKAHACMAGNLYGFRPHNIEPGERARYAKFLMDGRWEESYVCLPCIERWIEEWE